MCNFINSSFLRSGWLSSLVDDGNLESTCEMRERMQRISLLIPRGYLSDLDELVRRSMYPNRSEAIRVAIRDLLNDELWETSKDED